MKSNSEISKLIRSVLKERGISEKDFKKDYLEGSKATKSRFFTGQKNYSVQEIVWFCYLMNEKPNKFGIEESKYLTPFNQSSSNSSLDYLQFKSVGIKEKNKTEFINDYFNTLIETVKKTEKKLMIYDYFSKRKRLEKSSDTELYLERYNDYLEAIEEVLDKNPDVEYYRVMVLPLEIEITREVNISPSEVEEGVKKVIEYCFVNTFRHIYNCLMNYPERAKFYVSTRPSWQFSFATIDDSKISYTEYDRLNKNFLIASSRLYIDRSYSDNDVQSNIIINDTQEIEHSIFKCKGKINLSSFDRAAVNFLRKIELDVKLEKEKLEKEYDEVINNLEIHSIDETEKLGGDIANKEQTLKNIKEKIDVAKLLRKKFASLQRKN